MHICVYAKVGVRVRVMRLCVCVCACVKMVSSKHRPYKETLRRRKQNTVGKISENEMKEGGKFL